MENETVAERSTVSVHEEQVGLAAPTGWVSS